MLYLALLKLDMAYIIVFLSVVTLVQCFHVPLPYGTGFQDRNQDHELSGQGIFHLLWNAFANNEPPQQEKDSNQDDLLDTMEDVKIEDDFSKIERLREAINKELKARNHGGWRDAFIPVKIVRMS